MDIWLDTCLIGTNNIFFTKASLYMQFITKYKLLKDFLFSYLIYFLIIDRFGQLINIYIILILF